MASACSGSPKSGPPADAPPTLRASSGAQYLAHEVIVRRPEGVELDQFRIELESLGGRLEADDDNPLADLRYHRVSLPDEVLADEAISSYLDDGLVESADRNYIVSIEALPDDPDYGQLWGMARIGAEAAWDLHTGSEDIIVAIVDSGIDANHVDLRDNLWRNPGEIAGNGIDDDGNGYVDDQFGYDWVSRDGNPADDHGHGSHVAGTVGATGNNGKSIVGVNWRVRMQALKVLGANGSGSLWGGAQAVLYAANSGAKVVNASWGCPGCYTSYMQDAIEALDRAGGLFVAAAGNDSNNNDAYPYYPASHDAPNVVAVAATDSNDQLASFSNYGKTRVHLAAPGVQILSALPGGRYASWAGTSMAAPHVAGAAALMLAYRGEQTPSALRQKLMDSTDPVPALASRTVSGGRLQVYKLLTLDGDPPPAPGDVRAEAGEAGDVTVSWSAPADDMIGEYVVHAGRASGSYSESHTVLGAELRYTFEQLPLDQPHYFAVQAKDTAGNPSELSAEVSATPVDRIAPAQVLDLWAEPLDSGVIASGRVVEASGEYSDFYAAAHAHDGDLTSDWSTPPRAIAQEESVVVELDQAHVCDRVELWPSATYPDHFPLDFELEASLDGHDWQALAGQRNARAQADSPLALTFPPTELRFVRLRVLRAFEHASGLFYVALSELRVRTLGEHADDASLTFSAPGNNPGVGAASDYDLRVSRSPLTEANFDGADSLPTPAPAAAPAQERVTVTGLSSETTYYFALRANDGAGNRSPMSNVATLTTRLSPPSAITDLRVVDAGDGSLMLEWTAPGDNGSAGQASGYELRYATFPLHAGNFAAGVQASGVPSPAVSGSLESFTLAGLSAGVTYYVALRSYDRHNLPSGLSNIESGSAHAGPDQTPPAQVAPLQASVLSASAQLAPTAIDASGGQASAALDGDLLTSWAAGSASTTTAASLTMTFAGDEPVLLTGLRLRPSGYPTEVPHYPSDFTLEGSVDGTTFRALLDVQGLRGQAGRWDSWGITPSHVRYLRLRVTRRGPGACGDTGSCDAADVIVSELQAVVQQGGPRVELRWVAPGDDGWSGTAERYDLRFSSTALSGNAWADASALSLPAPAPGGSLEAWSIDNPSTGPGFYALRAIDDEGQAGPFSEPAMVHVPSAPPAPVDDLTASALDSHRVQLSWTAEGGNGTLETASRYEIRYATSPIDGYTWDAAELLLDPPTPSQKGTPEGAVVGGLLSDTRYFFALRAFDEANQDSGLSNLASAQTLDGTAPARITDLQAAALLADTDTPLSVTLVAASPAHSLHTGAERALDGEPSSFWLTAPDSADAERFLHLRLSEAQPISRVSLHAAADYPDLFPNALAIDVRNDDSQPWRTVSTLDHATARDGALHVTLGSVAAGELRLRITNASAWAGSYYAALSEVALFGDPARRPRASLSWTAPGDDGDRGRADHYALARATTPIDDLGFDAAEPLPNPPTPAPAGSLERLSLGELPWNSQTCFAVRASDEAGNTAAASNSPCITTPDAPPPGISDLSASLVGQDGVTLSWTAPDKPADHYELRMAQVPIDQDNWDDTATVQAIEGPTPLSPGDAQALSVTGLASFTRYHFAVRAVDGAGQRAVVSNNASVQTPDTLAPAPVVDLTATPIDAGEPISAGLALADSSGHFSPSTLPEYALDGRAETIWLSQAGDETSERSLTARLPGPTPIAEIALRASDAYPDLFPVDFRIEARSDGGAWHTLVHEQGVRNASGWQRWAVGSVSIDELRLVVTRSSAWSGAHYTAVAELRALVDSSDRSAVRLSWTAPGDDGDLGRAREYELRRASTPLTAESFSAGEPIATAPPQLAGSLERSEVHSLPPGSQQCFALITRDDEGLASGLSNSPCLTLPDLPPGVITDLSATAVSGDMVALQWTAPGASGADGRADHYELRMASERIHLDNWADAIPVPAPTPSARGQLEQVQVTDLSSLTTYYFAVRAINAGGDTSGLSNNASATTLDNQPPDAVADLRLSTDPSQWGALIARFTSPADNGSSGRAARYDLRVSEQPIDASNFELATPVATPAPAAAGSEQSLSITGLAPEATHYAAMRAFDEAGNAAPISNLAMAETRPEAPAAIEGLSVSASDGSGLDQAWVTLSWTATGDDDRLGRADRYVLRYARTPIDASNFASATLVPGTPTPAPAGQAEQFTITGLAVDSDYHFALAALDERGLASPLSIVATKTPDGVAPAPVTDLRATTGTGNGRIDLTWTAPGDNGPLGRASRYELRYSEQPIDANNFAAATAVTSPPKPAQAGSTESAVVQGLGDERSYYFALRTIDDVGLTSELSNLTSARTADVKPAAVTNLRATATTLDSVSLAWSASGDDGQVGKATRYELRMALTPIDANNFVAASLIDSGTPAAPGGAEQHTQSGLSANTTYYFALLTFDERGNASALSNVLSAGTRDDQAPATVADLAAATGPVAGAIVLSWTAPGDDGQSGRAHHYELRRDSQPITAATWDAATPINGTPTPKTGGSAEQFTVTGLSGERTHHFALRALDEADNAGGLSNSAQADTLPIAPGTVSDLGAVAIPGGITLSWTAPGDDGQTGTATRYELRRALAPISLSSWPSATPITDPPTPATAGTRETYTLLGTAESTTYYFALRAIDDTGTAANLSNVAQVRTLDETAPAAPGAFSLSVPNPAGVLLHGSSASASSELGSLWVAGHALDGKAHTSWASRAMAVHADQTLTVQVSQNAGIDRVRLRADAFHPDLFPREFEIQVGSDGAGFATVANEWAFSAPTGGAFMEWGFPAASGNRVRVIATDTAASYGQHYAIIADVEAYSARPSLGKTRLTWLSPGDDGQNGRADHYEIYRSESPFNADSLASATPVGNPPIPATAGSIQSIELSDLLGETTYYWALRAVDEAGNVGPLSSVISIESNAVAPRTTTDLFAETLSQTDVQLSWTAPGDDDDRGQAARYEVRYAPFPITNQNFSLASALSAATPAPAGQPESLAVHSLSPGTTYRFALIAYDEANHASYLSNIAQATTVEAPDVTPPGQITDLQAILPDAAGLPVDLSLHAFESDQAPAFAAADVADGDPGTMWVSAARDTDAETYVQLQAARSLDAGVIEVWPAAGYADLFPRSFTLQISPDGLSWTTIHSEVDYVASAGVPVTASFSGETAGFVALHITAQAGGGGAPFQSAVAEITLSTGAEAPGTAYVGWTAPGDDDFQGTAANYELLHAPCPFDAAQATSVPTFAPGAAGSIERYRIEGLPSGLVCIAVRAQDEVAQWGPLSDIAQIAIP